jgi:hypothetical protein
MAPNTDSRENVITWFTREFGFSRNAATTLHDVKALKDTQVLSKLDNDIIANICKAVGKDVGQSVAKIATTKLKLRASGSDTSTGPQERWGDPKTTCKDRIQW